MLKKLYDKSDVWFSVICIVVYCILMSVADAVSLTIGIEKLISLPVSLLLSLVLLVFLKKNNLFEMHGLCKPKTEAKEMFYYLPLLVLLTANLWYGVNLNYSITETILYILTMLCVGFLEEIIFRGLLFGAMLKNNLKCAVIVSSITFGIGHIINLFNGSGAELIPNLMQVIYASSAGFMFVMIYYKTKSLISCIVTHGLFNALSAFSNESLVSTKKEIISCILLSVITGAYAVYIAMSMRVVRKSEADDDYQ